MIEREFSARWFGENTLPVDLSPRNELLLLSSLYSLVYGLNLSRSSYPALYLLYWCISDLLASPSWLAFRTHFKSVALWSAILCPCAFLLLSLQLLLGNGSSVVELPRLLLVLVLAT